MGGAGYVAIPQTAALNPTPAVTVEAWVRYTGPIISDAAIVGTQYGNDTRNSFNLFARNNNSSIGFEVTNSAGVDAAAELFTGLTLGQWYHLAGSYDGSALNRYVDGILRASTPFSGSISYPGSKPILIGADNEIPAVDPTWFFPGNIDEVRISNVALSPSQFLNAYENSTRTFDYAFNLRDDWGQYLHSATNAEVYTELVAGGSQPATFWRSTPINTWGEVVYHFPMSFEIATANLETQIFAFTTPFVSHLDPGAQAYLDVSSDGINWTTVMDSYPGNGGPRTGPGDISSIVRGGTDVWVRARLLSTLNWPTDGSIFAQFMRTGHDAVGVGEGGPPLFDLHVVGVPEPSTYGLLLLMCFAMGARRFTPRRPRTPHRAGCRSSRN